MILRRAKTLAELPAAEEKVVWSKHPAGEMSCNIWAPESHFTDGKWVIYFAAAREGADETGCFDHRTYALVNRNVNPMEGEFTEAGRITSTLYRGTAGSAIPTGFTAPERRNLPLSLTAPVSCDILG